MEKEKEDLLKEIAEVTERKDAEIDSLNRELSEYIQKISDLSDATLPNYGKTIDKLGERQRARRIKELKRRADVALWFLESHGLSDLNKLCHIEKAPGLYPGGQISFFFGYTQKTHRRLSHIKP